MELDVKISLIYSMAKTFYSSEAVFPRLWQTLANSDDFFARVTAGQFKVKPNLGQLASERLSPSCQADDDSPSSGATTSSMCQVFHSLSTVISRVYWIWWRQRWNASFGCSSLYNGFWQMVTVEMTKRQKTHLVNCYFILPEGSTILPVAAEKGSVSQL